MGRIYEQAVRSAQAQTLAIREHADGNLSSLGLRSVAAKTLLLLCDLYFVVFAASNLSLAFDTLYDHRWACYDELFATYTVTSSNNTSYNYNVASTCPNNPSICFHQKTLGGILLISLVAWLLTFSMSVMRVVEKLRPD